MIAFETPWALLALLALPLYWLAARQLGVHNSPLGRAATRLRLALTAGLVIATAGPLLLEKSDVLAVIYVLDASRSTSPLGEGASGGSEQGRAFVQRSLAHRPEGDLAGVIVFASAPEIEALVGPESSPPLWGSRPPPGGTDIEAALRLALATFPPDTHRRVVLLSDGVETKGSAAQQAVVARELGAPIDVVTLQSASSAMDIVVEGLRAPSQLLANQPLELRVQTRSARRTKATIRLYNNGQLVGSTEVLLRAGIDVITLPQDRPEPGLNRYRVEVSTSTDPEPRNNSARATVKVAGQPSVLLLEGYSGAAVPLEAALSSGGFSVQVGGPEDLPDTLEEMARYGTIILSDVAAPLMSRTQMLALERYVVDLGQGLVMLGGDQSFGVGGYYKTAVERVLPVKMTRKAQLQMPSQGIVLAIDRSGSMAGVEQVSKMEIAKEASAAVVELMTSRDELGVLAFDSATSWVVPYARIEDKLETIRRIATMRAGGGTNIYRALASTRDAFDGGSARTRHVILLSDGMSNASDMPGIVDEMVKKKITLTTISIGKDSDRHTMEKLAHLGGGRYYECESAQTLPQIFTRETMLTSRNFLVEGTFAPTRAEGSEVLKGIDAVPSLDGYVATTAKAGATLAMQTPQGDPLLAHWRHGLGRSMAFTSDAKGRWASRWVETPEVYVPFWNQALRWVSQTGANESLTVATSLSGGALTVTADVREGQSWGEGAQTSATVLHPDGRRETMDLSQIAPGRYQASVGASLEGTYHVSVSQRLSGEEGASAVREVHRAYSPEFAPSHTGASTLQSVASASEGKMGPAPQDVWRHSDAPVTTPTPLTPYLLLLLLGLFLGDVAFRRFEGWRWPSGHASASLGPLPPERARPGQRGPPASPVSAGDGDKNSAPGTDSAPEREVETEDGPQFTRRLLEAKKRSRKK